jgi:hypothetical protein
MRSLGFALLLLVSPAAIAPAAATARDRELLKKFGMLGRLAIDCAAPASRENPYVTFAVAPDGKATRTLEMKYPGLDATLPIRNVRLLSADRLQYDETGRQSELIVTFAKIDGKFRSWHSMRANGTVLVADGKFVSSGAPTQALQACRN